MIFLNKWFLTGALIIVICNGWCCPTPRLVRNQKDLLEEAVMTNPVLRCMKELLGLEHLDERRLSVCKNPLCLCRKAQQLYQVGCITWPEKTEICDPITAPTSTRTTISIDTSHTHVEVSQTTSGSKSWPTNAEPSSTTVRITSETDHGNETINNIGVSRRL